VSRSTGLITASKFLKVGSVCAQIGGQPFGDAYTANAAHYIVSAFRFLPQIGIERFPYYFRFVLRLETRPVLKLFSRLLIDTRR
jgi:hypothetical protein